MKKDLFLWLAVIVFTSLTASAAFALESLSAMQDRKTLTTSKKVQKYNDAVMALGSPTTFGLTAQQAQTIADSAKSDADAAAADEKNNAVGPGVVINAGGGAGTIAPYLEYNKVFASYSSAKHPYKFDLRVAIKPEPASGKTEDVSQAIRADAGTITAGVGGVVTYSMLNGALSFNARGGVNVSYQRAPETDGTGENSFGIVTPEGRLTLWIVDTVLFGYRYNHLFSFGRETSVEKAVRGTDNNQFIMLIDTSIIPGFSGAVSTPDSPSFLEFAYSKVGDGTATVAFTKAFQWK